MADREDDDREDEGGDRKVRSWAGGEGWVAVPCCACLGLGLCRRWRGRMDAGSGRQVGGWDGGTRRADCRRGCVARRVGRQDEEVVNNPDIHFEPIVKLEEVEVRTLEEDEDVEFKLYGPVPLGTASAHADPCRRRVGTRRAKLFRFDRSTDEWKERGVGEVKLLRNRETNKIRLLMRRDKTLKVCANHLSTCPVRASRTCARRQRGADAALWPMLVTPDMRLTPNVGSDRSWVWNVLADVSEGAPTHELLAIRFANTESTHGRACVSPAH
jgi:Ran-binding protein 1